MAKEDASVLPENLRRNATGGGGPRGDDTAIDPIVGHREPYIDS
jgi:hypothetical protein